jgi:predicted nucleic acid-binding protein
VKYLLDVNVLVALGFRRHSFHARVAEWQRQLGFQGIPEFATCAITELGFLRIVAQAAYEGSVATAKPLLRELKSAPSLRFTFLSDELDASSLPGWVVTAKQTTDGHLLQLANANGILFATLDEKIPGAFLIPA